MKKMTSAFCRFRLLLGCFFVVFFAGASTAHARDTTPFKRILLVDSYSSDDVWSGNCRSGFQAALREAGLVAGIESVDLCIHYQPGLVPAPGDIEALRAKLAGSSYDLIVTAGSAAANLFLDGVLEIPEGTPLVVAYYAGSLRDRIPEGAAITGVEIALNQYNNVALGCRLLPDNRTITILFEATEDGKVQCRLFREWLEHNQQLNDYHVRILSGEEYTGEEVLKIVSELPSGSLLLFHSWSSDLDGPENVATMLPRVREEFSGLILGKYAGYMDFGSTGGYVISGNDQGRQAGAIAAKVLRGTRAADIPVQPGTFRLLLDFPSLLRAGVDPSLIPAQAEVLHEPPKFLAEFLDEILWSGAIVALLLIFLAVWQQLNRRTMRKLRGMFSHLTQSVFVVAPSGKVLYCHVVAGIPSGIYPLRHLNDMPRVCRGDFIAAVRETFRTGRKQEFDYQREGRSRHVEFVLLPDGLFGRRAVMWISSDQTELQQAHRTTAELAERFRLTLESIGDGVIATDIDQRVTLINPVAAALIGITPEDARGRLLADILHLVSYLDGKPVPSPLSQALAAGRIVELANHTDLLALDGQRYHIADSAAPIRDPAGEVTGGVLVFRDVTTEYDRRDQLKNTLTSLEYASELTSSSSFRMNLRTRDVTGSRLLSDLWPLRDGKAVPREEFVYPEDLESYTSSAEAVLAGENTISTWMYRSNFSGELRYYRMRASVDRSVPDDPVLFGVIQDITEITISSGRLKEALELWELAINSIPVMFFAKDADREFRYALCNQAFADFHGKRREEILGRTDAELFPQKDATERFRRQDIEAMTKPDGENFEDTLQIQGRPFHFHTTKRPFLSGDGRRLLLGAINDVSELQHLIDCERFNGEVLSHAVGDTDFDSVLNYIAERVQQQMQGNRVVLGWCDDDGHLRFGREWYADGLRPIRENDDFGQHYRIWEAYTPRLREKQVIRITDFVRDELFGALRIGLSHDIASLLIAPIFEEERFAGALFVTFGGSIRNFSEADETLVRSCANVIALAQVRHRQEETIRRHEREMHLILDYVNIPLSLHAADGKLLHVNPAVCRMTGLSTEELLASHENEVFYHGVVPPPDSPLKQVIAGKKSATAELRIGNRQYLVHADAVIDDQGKLINIVKDATDVTELNDLLENQRVTGFCLESLFTEENAEKAISEVLKAISGHLDASRCYIFKMAPEQRSCRIFLEYAEPGCDSIFAPDVDFPLQQDEPWLELLRQGQPLLLYDWFQPEQRKLLGSWSDQADHNNMRSLFLVGMFQHGELWGNIGLAYENRPCRELSAADQELLSTAAHLIEILLARQAAHDRLTQALELATAAEKAKSFFIASVSHEIRTPLNSVIGFSELLRVGGLSPELQDEYLGNVVYSGNALLQLINDVLDLSKLEADQLEIVPAATDFEVLAEEILKVFAFRTKERNLELTLEMPRLPELELDRQRVRQILFNLIGNAVKFTENGRITLRAEFSATDGEQGIFSFMVEDTGTGIAEEDRKRLMEPFVQLSNARGNSVAGTGLGLSITKRLAEKMNGRLWVESELGRGSVFGITLNAVGYHEHRQAAAGTVTPAVVVPAVAGALSVLLVDDVEMNLIVLKAMIGRIGVKDAESATSGAAALELMKKRRFDLVMTDIWMPGMSGTELLLKIRAEYGDLPVVAVTADVEARSDLEQQGFSGVLLKPITLEKLSTAIGHVFELRNRQLPE